MTLQKQLTIWLIALVSFILLLWLLSPILLPFVAGMVLAYFLDPVADWLERLGLGRVFATALILISSLLGLVVVFILVLPVLANQLMNFAADLPALFKSMVDSLNAIAPESLKSWLQDAGINVQQALGRLAGTAATWVGSFASSVWSGGIALVNVMSLAVVTPVVAFYLLADWDRMIAKIDTLLPREHAATIRDLASEINTTMSGFVRGQGTVCILLAVFYAVALSLAGLKFGLVIGVVAGALTFIPYVGALLGGIAAIGVALVQFWPDVTSILIVAGIFFLGQFLEGNFLSPKLVGSSIGLHPVWLMFALFAFGYVFGFVGLVLAVPMAAAAGVLVRYAISKYQASSLYSGVASVPQPKIVERRSSRKQRKA